jgi:hypothetical protein
MLIIGRIAPRTIGPLHVEDLEARWFENMVRQLIYDFRNGQMLEATGRSGSDSGFDARGLWFAQSKCDRAGAAPKKLRRTEYEDTESETTQYGDSSLAIILLCLVLPRRGLPCAPCRNSRLWSALIGLACSYRLIAVGLKKPQTGASNSTPT